MFFLTALTGGKKWVPLEIGPPPNSSSSKLRGKIVNRSNSEYYVTNELLNGSANGYGEDYKSSKYGSTSAPRNPRSTRPRRIGGETMERNSKVPLAYPVPADNIAKTGAPATLSVTTTAAHDTAPADQAGKKVVPTSISPVSPTSQAAVNPPSVAYIRRNTGPRGGGRGAGGGGRGILAPRSLNRSRSQTGVDAFVPVSLVNAGTTLTAGTNVPVTSSINTIQCEEFVYNFGYFYYGNYYVAGADAIPITTTSSAVASQTFMQPSYYYSVPQYDADRLKEMLRTQIEYYFSEENLQRDFFLRRKMDEGGFLPISLIASFHRVQALTQDVSLVVEALANSTTVEIVDGVKLRTRHDPTKWPLVSLGVFFVYHYQVIFFFLFKLDNLSAAINPPLSPSNLHIDESINDQKTLEERPSSPRENASDSTSANNSVNKASLSNSGDAPVAQASQPSKSHSEEPTKSVNDSKNDKTSAAVKSAAAVDTKSVATSTTSKTVSQSTSAKQISSNSCDTIANSGLF